MRARTGEIWRLAIAVALIAIASPAWAADTPTEDNVRVQSVDVVVSLRESTFYGALSIEIGGEAKVFDARSSDAIALAIHFSAPILVGRSLLESAGRELGDPPGSQRL